MSEKKQGCYQYFMERFNLCRECCKLYPFDIDTTETNYCPACLEKEDYSDICTMCGEEVDALSNSRCNLIYYDDCFNPDSREEYILCSSCFDSVIGKYDLLDYCILCNRFFYKEEVDNHVCKKCKKEEHL